MRRDVSRLVRLHFLILLLAGLLLAACDEFGEEDVETLMQRAIEARDKGALRDAVVDLKAVLQQEPDNTEVRYILGQIYLGIGDARSAEKELIQAQDLGAKARDIQFLIGRARLLRGDYAGVLKDYRIEESSSAETRSKFSLLRGKAHLARRELDKAETSFRKALAAYKKDITEERPHLKITEPPESAEALAGIAKVAVERKDWFTARSTIDRAFSIAPENVDVLVARGELNFNQKKYEESEQDFAQAFKRQPNNLVHQIGIARAQLMLHKADEALENLKAVLKHFPEHVITNYYLSLAHLQKKDYQTAKNISEKILKIRSSYLQAHLVAGVASFGLDNMEQANVNLKRYLAGAPGDEEAQRLLGLTQLRLSKPEQALNTLRPLYDTSPENTELISLIATAAAGSGDLEMAGNYYQKIVDINPEDEKARLNLVAVKLGSGKSDEALQDLERAVKESPNFLRGQYALLTIHLRERDFDKVLAIAKNLQDADPENPTPLIAAGLAHAGKSNWADGLRAFQRALEINPNHVGAAYGIADIHIQNEAFDRARAVYERILESQAKHHPTFMRLIGLAQKQENSEETRRLIERAMEANPDEVDPRLLAAQLQLERNEPIKALAVLAPVANAHPDHPGLLQVMGRAQVQANKPGDAALTLERLVRMQPNSAAAHYLLSQAYALLNNRGRMHSELDQTLAIAPRFLPAGIARIRGLAVDNNMTAAKQRLEELKQTFPENEDVISLEAWLAMRDDRPGDAVQILVSLSEKDDSETLAIRLAAARWKAGDQAKAIQGLEDWIAQNSDTRNALLELSNYYVLTNKDTKAREAFVRLVEIDPDNWLVLNNLAALLEDKDAEMALNYAERAFKLAPTSPPVVLTLSEILLKTGTDFKRVIDLTRPLVRKFPENSGIHVTLATALAKSGERERATSLLTDFIARSTDSAARAHAEKALETLKQSSAD